MKSLYAFGLGVVLTGLFAWGYGWSINYQWEWDCLEHGAGYFYIKDITKPSLEYRWFQQERKTERNDSSKAWKRSGSII